MNPSIAKLLQAREKRFDPRFSYKLVESGNYGMDVSIGEMDINEAEMSVTFPFADGRRRDGVGDLLEVGGINTERHKMNPVVLYDHGKAISLPIGLTEDPRSKAYTVSIDPVNQVATCKAFFYQARNEVMNGEHALFCEQLFDLMAKKYIRAGSIGYQVVHARELPPDFERGTPKGLHLMKTLMLEASVVVMPANQDTVRKALCLGKVCGKSLSPYLVKSLTSYSTDNTKTVVGFTVGRGQLTRCNSDSSTALGHCIPSPPDKTKSIRDQYKRKQLPKVKSSNPPSIDQVKQILRQSGVDVLTVTQSGGHLNVMVPHPQIKQAEGAIYQSGWSKEVLIRGGDKSMDFKDIRSLYKKKSLPEKAIVSSGNVMDYSSGGVVAARSQLFYYPSGKTTPFAKPGEKLKVVEVEPNGMIKVRRADGQQASFSSAEVRKTKELEQDTKGLKDIRLKYRKSKGFRRTLRKGVSGSSMVYVNNKDLESVKKLAAERGLDAKYVGSKNGLEKVRLTGDEKAMDDIATQYGRPIKRLARSETRSKNVRSGDKAPNGWPLDFKLGGESWFQTGRGGTSRSTNKPVKQYENGDGDEYIWVSQDGTVSK